MFSVARLQSCNEFIEFCDIMPVSGGKKAHFDMVDLFLGAMDEHWLAIEVGAVEDDE